MGPCGSVLSNSKVDTDSIVFIRESAFLYFFFSRAALFQATTVFISYEALITPVVHLHYI